MKSKNLKYFWEIWKKISLTIKNITIINLNNAKYLWISSSFRLITKYNYKKILIIFVINHKRWIQIIPCNVINEFL